jgi:transposase
MISPDQVHCVIEPIDMRRGMHGLSQWLQARSGKSACDGTAYAFANRSKTRLKLLIWDGTGVWCCQRRLHRGAFIWPSVDDTQLVLTQAQWNYLIKGIDWQRISAQPRADWRV